MSKQEELIAKLKESLAYLLRYWIMEENGEKSQRMLNFESEISALEQEQEPLKTAEEVLRRYWIFSIDNPDTQRKCIIEAIHEYHNQFASQNQIALPDDEEIEKELNALLPERNNDYTSGFGKGLRICAKWMRDKANQKK